MVSIGGNSCARTASRRSSMNSPSSRHGITTETLGIRRGCGSDDSGFGNRNDEPSALLGEGLHLYHDLVLEVPGQDHHVGRARPGLPVVDALDADVGPRRIAPLL